MAEIRKLEKYRPISEVFNLFYQEEDTVILESSLTNSLGKYSIIGRRPYHKIEKFSQSIRINGQNEDMDFKHYVKSYFVNIMKEIQHHFHLPQAQLVIFLMIITGEKREKYQSVY